MRLTVPMLDHLCFHVVRYTSLHIYILYRHCAAFVFLNLLRRDIREFMNTWNTHRMRVNQHAGCPTGVPNDMYYLSPRIGKGNIY